MLAVRIGQLTAEVFHLLDLQPCWLLRRLCHLVLAFPIERDVTNSRVPSLHGHYSASSLRRTHPPPARLRSTSRFSRLYDLPCSGGFLGREGFTNHSMCPCHRAVASTPPKWVVPHRSDFGIPCCLRPTVASSARGSLHFRGHICVYCRYGPVTRDLPKETLSMGFQDFGDFGHPRHPAIRTTGLLTFALAGLSPAEHTSVYWSQHTDMTLSRHPALTPHPPVARLVPTRQTAWGPVARCAPASASTLVLGV